MAWNFLQIVESGAWSDDLYPVPTGRGVGFELSAEDTNQTVLDIAGVKVVRQTGDGPWIPSLNVLRVSGRLVISDRRIAVTFGKFVPKDQSSFDPVVVVHPDGSTTKRPKYALVGQLLMVQMRQIGVRGGIVGQSKLSRNKGGDEGLGSIIVSATDETGGSGGSGGSASGAGSALGGGQEGFGDHVAIEIILAAGTDPVAVGNVVLSRSALARVSSPLFSIDQPVRQQWAELIHQGFSPAPGEMENHLLSPYQVVRVGRPVAAPSSLTPPTDTSPVPTMFPTPAFPMPSLGGLPMPESPSATNSEREFVDPPTRMTASTEPSQTASLAPPGTASTGSTPGPEPTNDVGGLPEPLVPAPPPPGSTAEWRPDPFRRFELRFWDGFGWTEHVHSDGEQRTDEPR